MAHVKDAPRSTLRAERAGVTRARIAAAARDLFTTRGYGSTTLTAIAQEAGVAVQTVYAVYGSKVGILRALREDLRHQPDAEAAYVAALHAPSAAEALSLFARSIRERWEDGHDIVMIHADAAAADPTIRQEVEAVLAVRRAGIARLAESLRGHRAPGVNRARAAAMIDALTLPEVYRELVEVEGWSPAEYEAWLSATLRHAVLGR